MTSQKQSEANLRNAAKSTGPRTMEGKLTVRTNALGLGMFAKMILLPGEDEAEYRLLLEAYFALWEPQNLIEERAVRDIANMDWRRERLDKAEQAYLSDLTHQEAARREYKPQPNGACTSSDPALRVLGDIDEAEIRAAIDQALLTKGMELEPDARDLRQALKGAFTQPGSMQVCANFDYRRRLLARNKKHAEEALEASRARRTTIEGQGGGLPVRNIMTEGPITVQLSEG